jgi:hypothetical protein
MEPQQRRAAICVRVTQQNSHRAQVRGLACVTIVSEDRELPHLLFCPQCRDA